MRGIFGAPERLDLPSTPDEGAEFARRYVWRIWRVVLGAGLVGSLPGIISIATSTPTYPKATDAFRATVISLAAIAFITAGTGTWAYFAVRKRFEPVARWLTGSRPATESERAALAAVPRRVATWGAFVWALSLVWWLPFPFVVGRMAGFTIPPALVGVTILSIVVSIAAGGATGVVLGYLLVERSLRPLTALAGRGDTSRRPSTLGALSRLLMAFGAGIAVPLVSLSLGLVGLDARQRAAAYPSIWAGIAAVIVVGFVIAFVAARALTEPLARVQAGLDRVGDGELDVLLDVDEPGEMGRLQAGFNKMVEGLRERERIRDVFGRLVGKEVAAQALETGATLSAEVREATAMFVDIVGSTPLAESTGPGEYLTHLNSFFDIVIHAVEAAGGLVNQFQGDGALCIFGAPSVQDDHAVRALRAARDLRAELDRFARTSGVESVIGVSTGQVVAGHIGTADRYEFTVVGDAVNEAKRLAEQAKSAESKVLVSEATIRAAEGEVANWRESGSTQLRGRSAPTVAFGLQEQPDEAAPLIRLDERRAP